MTKDETIQPDDSLLEPLKENLAKAAAEEDWKDDKVLALCRDDHFLRRCLLSRHNDLKKTTQLAITALKFREKVKPSNLTVTDFPTACSQQCFSFAGYDKHNGWPVLHCRSKNWNPWAYSIDEYTKEIAFNFEKGEQMMDPNDPNGRMIVIMDMKGMSKLNSDFGKLRMLAKVTCDYYPERLGYAVTCNADFVTWLLWKFISPLLDQRNRDRVRMYRGDYHEFLEELVGMENVGPALGGDRDEEWPPLTEENQNELKWGSDLFPKPPMKKQEPTAHKETSGQAETAPAEEVAAQ